MDEEIDLKFLNHGSIFTCMALTDAGREWLDDNVEYDQYPVVIEPRYVENLVLGAEADGLIIG